MLYTVLQDHIDKTECSNEPLFDTTFDWSENNLRHKQVAESYGKLSKAEKKSVPFLEYLGRNGVRNPKDEALIPSKNYALISNEAAKRVDEGIISQSMPIDTMDFERSLMELAESIENTALIRDIYRFKKRSCGRGAKDGISQEEAAKLRHCLIQGRELYNAGLSGSLLVKPLNFFYALTAYTYGIIVTNNPLRYHKGMLPGSHAMNYLPNDVHVQFGGDVPKGTFSDLLSSFPTHSVVGRSSTQLVVDAKQSIVDFYKIKHTVSIGTLLSMIPEMSEFYELSSEHASRVFPLEIVEETERRNIYHRFIIGNGQRKPTDVSIANSFPGFEPSEMNGRKVISVPADKSHEIRATIYTDTRGKFWYIDNPFFPVQLPEIAVHFLISFCYSNVMRYRPDEWGALINNEVDSQISLLTRHYFSVLERKFFPLVLRSLSKYYPYAID